MMHDDKQNLINLVADVRNGVDGAFEKLYHETVKIAYTHASMILKNRQDIEDVLQNSYMKVAENIGELKKPESFEIWLGTIVKRECLKYTEKNSRINDAFVRFKKVKEGELLAQEQVLSDAVENGETREAVQKALDKLSEKKRMCLVLYYFEQNSVSEIAEIMNVSEGTVLSRIYYARKNFETEFEKLRKKDENLLSVAAIPLLVSFIAYQAKNVVVPSAIEGAVIASVSAGGATAAASTTAASAAATSAAATSTVSAAGSTAATAVATKIAAVAVAASVATGGGVAVVNHIQEKNEETTVQYASSALTEEHATVAAVFAEETLLTRIVTAENSTYSGTAQISEILSVKEKTATHAVQTLSTEKTTVTEAEKTKRARISREYTLEAADTTALIATVKPTGTTTEKQITTTEETTEEETTEEETTTRKVTTTVEETTTEKPTTTEVPTTDASEVYGISGGVINEYTGSESKLVIPSKIGSSSVTAIGTSAFEGNADIESVSVPSGVTKIGQMAFADCTNLSSVSLPSTLTSIGVGAFCGCTSLSNVTIPSGVTTVGDDAFADCTSLSSVTIPSSVTSVGENAFGGCDNLTIKCSEGSAAHDYAVENSINYELV